MHCKPPKEEYVMILFFVKFFSSFPKTLVHSSKGTDGSVSLGLGALLQAVGGRAKGHSSKRTRSMGYKDHARLARKVH